MTASRLSASDAASIAAQMRRDGFDCTTHDVRTVWHDGYLDGREALASRIAQAFTARGLA